MSDKVAKIVIQEIMDKLEEGTIPWHKPWKVSNTTIMSYHGRPYRGINLFLTALSGRSGPWITYNQLKKQGGRVKDGEYKKSMPIILWKRPGAKLDAANVTGGLMHNQRVEITSKTTYDGTRFVKVRKVVTHEGKKYPQSGWLSAKLLKREGSL